MLLKGYLAHGANLAPAFSDLFTDVCLLFFILELEALGNTQVHHRLPGANTLLRSPINNSQSSVQILSFRHVLYSHAMTMA
jgi:hypothetical protein